MPDPDKALPRFVGPYRSTYPVFIYALRDPRFGCIRYIGQTNWPEARKAEHELGGWAEVKTVRSWVVFMQAEGLNPIFEILDQVKFEEAFQREAWWIRNGRLLGWPLLNKNNLLWEKFGISPISHKTNSLVPPKQKRPFLDLPHEFHCLSL